MATTKVRTEIWASQTLTAGAADTTSSAVNLTDGYGGVVMIRLLNGATGPTIVAQVQIECSSDNSEWRQYGGPLLGLDTNNGDISWVIDVPMGVPYLRLVAGSNTAQAVTAEAEFVEVTAV